MTDPIGQWIATLASLLSPMLPNEAAGPLRTMRPHLAQFPHAAFTPDTARQVAAAKRYGIVPSWDVIEPILRQAARDARPITYGRLPAPAEPDRQPRSLEEIARVSEMLRQYRSDVASLAVEEAERRPGLRDVSLTPEQCIAARDNVVRMHPTTPHARVGAA